MLVSIMQKETKLWGIASKSSKSYTTGPIDLEVK